jgi:hypothetical protein
MADHEQLSLLGIERLEQPRKSDAERIADIAARLLEEVEAEPPVDLELVASYRDIATIEVVPMAHAGSLAPAEQGFVMHLRAEDSLRRRRFTGFHEVGHTFQPGYREKTQLRCAARSPLPRSASDPEALADIAATELLLPRNHFQPLVVASDFSIESVTGLADEFMAGIQASAYRYSAFWPEPTLVLVLEPGLRKEERDDPEAEPKLRVVSAWGQPGDAWPYIPKNKSADPDGALVRALNGEVIGKKTGVEELEMPGTGNEEVTARRFDFFDGEQIRTRVIAIFRQLGRVDG